MKTNKKGFTLIEVVIVLAISAILSVFLYPSIINYAQLSKEKEDIVWSDQLAKVYVTAAQESKINYELLKLCDKCDIKQFVFTYGFVSDKSSDSYGNMDLVSVKYVLSDETSILTHDVTEIEGKSLEAVSIIRNQMNKIEEMFSDFVNGNIEPHKVQSPVYKNTSFEIVLTLGTRSFLAHEEHNWIFSTTES